MSGRRIYLENPSTKEVYTNFGWGDLAYLIFYSKDIDRDKTLNLIRVLLGEDYFNDLSGNALSGDKKFSGDIAISYNAVFLQNAIDFLDQEVIPSFQKEPEDIVEDKYNGLENLEYLIMTSSDTVLDILRIIKGSWFGVTEGVEWYAGTIGWVKGYLQTVKDIGADYGIGIEL